MELGVTVDSSMCERQLTVLHERQLPFAMARALTWVAADAQRDVRRELPHRFTIRNTFVARGIGTEKATKYRLQSEVRTKDEIGKTGRGLDFMERQEMGGTKAPKAGKHIAIPVNVKGNKKGIIRKSDRPKQLLGRGKYKSSRGNNHRIFKIDETTPAKNRHHLKPGIYAATGKSGQGRGLTMLYHLVRKADVSDRWQFEPTVNKTVNSRFARLFDVSFKDATK